MGSVLGELLVSTLDLRATHRTDIGSHVPMD